jgi:hypothetical protein
VLPAASVTLEVAAPPTELLAAASQFDGTVNEEATIVALKPAPVVESTATLTVVLLRKTFAVA